MNDSNAKYYFSNNRKFWNSSPFVKFLLPYCIGIVFYKNSPIYLSPAHLLFIFLPFLLLSFQISKRTYSFKNQNIIAGIYIFICLMVLGNLNAKINDPAEIQKSFLEKYSEFGYLHGVISQSSVTTHYFKYVVNIDKGRIKEPQDLWKKTIGKIILFHNGDVRYKPGDKIIVENKLKEIKPPKTPFDIDYKKIYAKQGIFLQQFLHDGDMLYSYGIQKFSLYRIAAEINEYLKSKLAESLSPQSYSIAAALLLGDKSALDDSTKSTFANSGIMHILAVSGLHVGILFLIINALFSFLKTFRHGKLLLFVVSVLLLWSFAFVTGLTSSVVRASLMFTVFSAGPLTGRRTFGINITAVSAILILLLNPYALFEIGFQLSFAAVFAILFFYKDIYGLMTFKHSIPDYLWQICSVSIAAQIGTFPLVVLYFQHFQPLFLLFNLIAIPFAFLVLTGGIVFLSTSFIPGVTDLIGFLLDKSIKWGVNIFEYLLRFTPELTLPTFTHAQVIILYLLMFSGTAFLIRKKLTFLALSIVLMAVFNAIHIERNLRRAGQEEVLLSQSGNSFIIDIVKGERFFSIYETDKDDKRLLDEALRKRKVLGASHIAIPEAQFDNKIFKLIVADRKSYLLLRETVSLPPDIYVDYLFLYADQESEAYYSKFADNIISLKSY